jgi:hypothetical protein
LKAIREEDKPNPIDVLPVFRPGYQRVTSECDDDDYMGGERQEFDESYSRKGRAPKLLSPVSTQRNASSLSHPEHNRKLSVKFSSSMKVQSFGGMLSQNPVKLTSLRSSQPHHEVKLNSFISAAPATQ